MKAIRLARIASRPFQSATPRLQTASSVKQSKPFPKVLSSISFHMSRSHWGGSFFVNATCISLSWISLLFALCNVLSVVIGSRGDDRENSRTANWLNYMPGNKLDGGPSPRQPDFSLMISPIGLRVEDKLMGSTFSGMSFER